MSISVDRWTHKSFERLYTRPLNRIIYQHFWFTRRKKERMTVSKRRNKTSCIPQECSRVWKDANIYIYSFVRKKNRNKVEELKTNWDVLSLRKAQLNITLNTALLRYVAGSSIISRSRTLFFTMSFRDLTDSLLSILFCACPIIKRELARDHVTVQ